MEKLKIREKVKKRSKERRKKIAVHMQGYVKLTGMQKKKQDSNEEEQ